MQNIDELEAFLLKHGESIVDMLGGEIDRIELKLKVIKYLLIFFLFCFLYIICNLFPFIEKSSRDQTLRFRSFIRNFLLSWSLL